MSLEPLFEAFGTVRRLREEEREALAAVVERRELRRRHHLLQVGDVCRHYAFVTEGCLRMFYVADGREHCVLFATEGCWLADLSSLHQGRPSHFYIDALEPSRVLLIRCENLWALWNRYHVFDRYFRVITEDAYSELQLRLVLANSVSAEERYVRFKEQYPALVGRLPAVQIASYPGITPEFLSKIKARLLRSGQ